MKKSITFSIVGLTLVAACSQPAAPPASPPAASAEPGRDDAAGTSLRHQRELRRPDRHRYGDASGGVDDSIGQTSARHQGEPDGTTLYIALSGSPIAPPGTDESKLPPPDRSADGIGVFDVKRAKLLRVIHADPIRKPPSPTTGAARSSPTKTPLS